MAEALEKQKSGRRPWLIAGLTAIIGAVLLYGGISLVLLGGSPYYVLAGIVVLLTAYLLWARQRKALWVYCLFLLATLAWALWESGLDGWALAARLAAPIVLGMIMLVPAVRRKLEPGPTPVFSFAKAAGAAAFTALVGLGLHAAFTTVQADPAYQTGTAAKLPTQDRTRLIADSGDDWLHYGNDPGGTRFSPLKQITPANVGRMELAWTYRIGPSPNGAPSKLQVTPIKVGETLYLCTAYNDIIALEADTGQQRWRFRSGTDATAAPFGACRGVTYYKSDRLSGACRARIITGTVDARLLAVDAETGKPCEDFGTHGIVSLQEGQPASPAGYYYVSSAPTLVRGKVVVGGWVYDNMYWGEPSGVIRAFDAESGKLSWAFDVGRPDRTGLPPKGESYTHSTPNSWAPMSADEELGTVYVPLGGAALDSIGIQRRPFDEEYAGAVVAIDAETGRERWHFQTVHHDLWDYDVPAQPTLVDLPVGGKIRRALVQATKRGEIFVLDRITGKPIFPVTDHPAPTRGAIPGERVAATQPYSDALPSFRGVLLNEKRMWGITPLDQMFCRIKFREARYDGPLTPPSVQPYIVSPGFLGGIDWGGVSIDPSRAVMVANVNQFANYNRLIPRAEANRLGVKPLDMRSPDAGMHGMAAQKGTGYAVSPMPFLSALFAPCQQPPYGRLAAVDLRSGRLLWERPVGTARDSGPLGLASMLPLPLGTSSMGGSITTGSGLIFMAATQDNYLRAFDMATGKTLWQARLPAGGQATPMTYRSARDGRQFVVQAAGGHFLLNTRQGDYILGYALRK